MEYFLTDAVRERIKNADRFVFVRNPKCGSTTVIRRLCFNLNNGITEDYGVDVHASKRFVVLQHPDAYQTLEPYDGDTIIFTTVRNAFDRYLSGLAHVISNLRTLKPDHKDKYQCVREYLNYNYDDLTPGKIKDAYHNSHHPDAYADALIYGCEEECFMLGHHLFATQSKTLDVIAKGIEYDLVLDVDQINETVDLMGHRLAELEGIPFNETRKERFNTSKIPEIDNAYWDSHPKLESFVRKWFAEDFERFGKHYNWQVNRQV